MKQLLAVLIGVLLGSQVSAQVKAKQAAVATPQIPASETTSPEAMARWLKTHTAGSVAFQRALFNWMATNIAYDAANMNRLNSYRDTAAAVSRTLTTKVGLCTDYAVLYTLVCRAGGINAVVVTGYALQNELMIPNGSHDWVAVKEGGQWTIVDPTWGAGYVDNGKFVQRTNWKWFQAQPQMAVKTHMPYDPMWQFSAHPLRHDELTPQGIAAAAKRQVFAYTDSIRVWAKQSRLQRLQAAAARIRLFGGPANPFIMSELEWMDQTISVLASNEEIERHNRNVDEFNEVNRSYREVVRLFNEYVNFKNRQFTPEMNDLSLRRMIDGVSARLGGVVKSLTGLLQVEAVRANASELHDAVAELESRVKTEQLFVGKYIKTEKGKRKQLFSE
jgi:hypothetical protein